MNNNYDEYPMLTAEEKAIARRRKIAEALMKQGQPTNEIQTAGGYVIPYTPLRGAADLFTTLTGQYIDREAGRAETDLAANREKVIAAELERIRNLETGTPGAPEQTAPFIPDRFDETDQPFDKINPIVTGAPQDINAQAASMFGGPQEPALNVEQPQITGDLRTITAPAVPAVAGDPRAAVREALLSRSPVANKYGALLQGSLDKKEAREEQIAAAKELKQYTLEEGHKNRMAQLAASGASAERLQAERLEHQKFLQAENAKDRAALAYGLQSAKQGAKESGGKKISNIDAKSIDRSIEKSSGANGALQLLDQAEALYGKYESSKTEPIIGTASRWGSAIGLGDKGRAQDYETAESISKDLGIIKLGLIGGSDTERELKVAIDTSPSPDKTVGTNREIIKNQRKAIEILQAEPDFKIEWVNRHGSLSAVDNSTGETYGKAWRKYQKEMWGGGNKGAAPAAPAAPSASVAPAGRATVNAPPAKRLKFDANGNQVP